MFWETKILDKRSYWTDFTQGPKEQFSRSFHEVSGLDACPVRGHSDKADKQEIHVAACRCVTGVKNCQRQWFS